LGTEGQGSISRHPVCGNSMLPSRLLKKKNEEGGGRYRIRENILTRNPKARQSIFTIHLKKERGPISDVKQMGKRWLREKAGERSNCHRKGKHTRVHRKRTLLWGWGPTRAGLVQTLGEGGRSGRVETYAKKLDHLDCYDWREEGVCRGA